MCGFVSRRPSIECRIVLVDEHLEPIHSQRGHDEFCCYFEDSKTLQLRPASTHEMTRENRICVLDIRGAPAREFETIRQRLKSTSPYMVLMQHDDDSLNDEALKTLCTEQENYGGYFLFNTRGRCAEHNLSWESILGFWTNLPKIVRSFDDPGAEVHFHYEYARQIAEAAVESAFARSQRTGSARRWDGTFFTTWPTQLIGSLAKVNRQRAEQLNQELQESCVQCSNQKQRSIMLANKIKCSGRTFTRWLGVIGKCCHLNSRKYSNRDNWIWINPRTMKPRQHEHYRNGRSGIYSDNIAIWCIHSLQNWHALCDTRGRDEKQYGLFSRKCVTQREKLDHYRFHLVQVCCLAICDSTSGSVLTWWTWKSETGFRPKPSM